MRVWTYHYHWYHNARVSVIGKRLQGMCTPKEMFPCCLCPPCLSRLPMHSFFIHSFHCIFIFSFQACSLPSTTTTLTPTIVLHAHVSCITPFHSISFLRIIILWVPAMTPYYYSTFPSKTLYLLFFNLYHSIHFISSHIYYYCH